jgi:hypothetical protein
MLLNAEVTGMASNFKCSTRQQRHFCFVSKFIDLLKGAQENKIHEG